MATEKAIPPTRFKAKALKPLFIPSSSWLYEIKTNEHRVVISQKRYSHPKVSTMTRPFMAAKKKLIVK